MYYHIETSATVLTDATSTADTWTQRNCLSSLKWQVPVAATEYDIHSDDDWTSEEEGRRSLYVLQRGHHQFSANGRCPECCRRTSRAQAGKRDLKSLRGQGHAWRVPRREGITGHVQYKKTIIYIHTYMYDFVLSVSCIHLVFPIGTADHSVCRRYCRRWT